MGRQKKSRKGWEHRDMPLFLSTYTNKVDKKGRVSVPASFRGELEKVGFNSFVAFPHPELLCVEGWDRERVSRLAQGMHRFKPNSTEYAAASTIMSKGRDLTFDPDGRVMLPENMLARLDPKEQVVFAGRGETFQIWRPDQFEIYEAEFDERAAQNEGNIHLIFPGPEGRDD